ncbi:uncharacterized protein LOC128767144 isoform X2 [Synchiropus splendidus]|uniref:uncharacterized protein LOC128767144 isoform X2 n=1 Tax=Synchiropus splendidus TaxID=270530 RepID=UPI00237EB653|nr:uncharacterized protein LOC128767144 isoform X2 [Synchiropus splendidus]
MIPAKSKLDPKSQMRLSLSHSGQGKSQTYADEFQPCGWMERESGSRRLNSVLLSQIQTANLAMVQHSTPRGRGCSHWSSRPHGRGGHFSQMRKVVATFLLVISNVIVYASCAVNKVYADCECLSESFNFTLWTCLLTVFPKILQQQTILSLWELRSSATELMENYTEEEDEGLVNTNNCIKSSMAICMTIRDMGSPSCTASTQTAGLGEFLLTTWFWVKPSRSSHLSLGCMMPSSSVTLSSSCQRMQSTETLSVDEKWFSSNKNKQQRALFAHCDFWFNVVVARINTRGKNKTDVFAWRE